MIKKLDNSPFYMSFSNKVNQYDWSLTSEQYFLYRPPPPASFFKKLYSFDIGLSRQKILDLGCGVGNLARIFAKQNCIVTGIDSSSNQIAYAKKMAKNENLEIQFENIASENIDFPENFFDVIIIMQSWPYFNKITLLPKIKKVLKPDGLIMIGNFDHLPKKDQIARETEKLMVKFNPDWKGDGFDGYIPPFPEGYAKYFTLKAMFYYDEPISFTNESWKGRIQASQAIGASLSKDKRKKFDAELDKLLKTFNKNFFSILHRISAHIMTLKELY
ncbi:MAG: class I SAM-dependent methyltransferase [Parachlamydiales bacterium]|nr:class I SAM-dependent methyltransferase [Parachlamydiales bacterium]